ncbi:MAG: GH3 auxin-responsive promoter family protein [Bacteroidetes bacterium]|nr:GH3 auxin-responsive promoter family protein [Bacteroidota bacterium]
MALLNSIFTWIMKKRIHQIELFMKYPHEVQGELIKNLISTAKDTEWGRKYDYAGIRSIDTFKERVPISSYEVFFPCIERIMKGEQNVLWPSDIKWFAKSSGTTNNRSKFIPVSEEALQECHYKGGKDLLSIYINNFPETELFSGKGLAMGGSHQENEFNPGTYYGDVSAVIMQNLPLWAQFIRTPNLKIALMDNWEEKMEKIAKITIKKKVTSLAGVPTWTVVLLRKILELTGKKDIHEVWPDLELFTHGAVSFTPYKELFKALIPSEKMNYLEIYNASEGFFGIQDRLDSDELLLMLDYGIFYEFMPIDELEKEHPKTLNLDEVELDKNYALVISTNAGLWRYSIGDTIKFTSLSPYRIKVSGRTKHFINAFGEEVIIDNAEVAVARACEETGAVLNDYTAAPIYFASPPEKEKRGIGETERKKTKRFTDSPIHPFTDSVRNSGSGTGGGHEWLIEFEKEPDDLNEFARILDNTLKEVNSDYEAKRYKDMALQMPVIHKLPAGTFYKWMKKRGKLGGQNKVPRLSNTREYVDDILAQI